MGNVERKEVFVGIERAGKSEFQVITDAQTGAVISQQWITKSDSKPGRPVKKENAGALFIRLYRTNLSQIVIEKRLDLPEAGLFLCLMSIVGWQTPYIVNPDTGENMSCSEIADYFHMDRKHVQDLIDRLVSKGIVSKVIRGKGLSNHFLLNTNLVFYGRTIDDLQHVDVFKNCEYEPKVYIEYKKTPKLEDKK
jgi:transposase